MGRRKGISRYPVTGHLPPMPRMPACDRHMQPLHARAAPWTSAPAHPAGACLPLLLAVPRVQRSKGVPGGRALELAAGGGLAACVPCLVGGLGGGLYRSHVAVRLLQLPPPLRHAARQAHAEAHQAGADACGAGPGGGVVGWCQVRQESQPQDVCAGQAQPSTGEVRRGGIHQMHLATPAAAVKQWTPAAAAATGPTRPPPTRLPEPAPPRSARCWCWQRWQT